MAKKKKKEKRKEKKEKERYCLHQKLSSRSKSEDELAVNRSAEVKSSRGEAGQSTHNRG